MDKLVPVNSEVFGLGWTSPSQITWADEFLTKKDDDRIGILIGGIKATIFARYLRNMTNIPRTPIGCADGSVMVWYTDDNQTLTSKVVGWDLQRNQRDGHVESAQAIPDYWQTNADGSVIKRPYRAVVRPDGSVFSPSVKREFKSVEEWQKFMRARKKKELALNDYK